MIFFYFVISLNLNKEKKIMSVNEKLKELYISKWQGLEKEMKKINSNPSNPLLLNIDEENYQKSKYKVMIFGQETNDWEGDFGNYNIEHLLEVYKNFSWGLMDASKKRKDNFFTTLGLLINKLNEISSPNYFIWNNIYKIGKAHEKGKPTDEIKEIENNYFNVIEEEVKILKPNAIIFFTGRTYDEKIKTVFGDFEHEKDSNLSKEEPIKKITLLNKDFNFIQSCYKTYHPRFLTTGKGMSGKRDFVINILCKNLF